MPNERIKTAFERNARAVSLRTSVGQGTARTRVRLREDLTCDVEDGKWTLVADMSEKHGSRAEGPDPGVFGRTAVGSCLAISYRLWAEKLEIPVDGIEVMIEADYDTRGMYGVDDAVPAGYRELRYIVTVESSAPEKDILRLLDTADRHSPWLDDMRRPVPVKREVHIIERAD